MKYNNQIKEELTDGSKHSDYREKIVKATADEVPADSADIAGAVMDES